MTPERLAPLAATLERELGPERVVRGAPLAPLTTYRVGGAAALFVLPSSLVTDACPAPLESLVKMPGAAAETFWLTACELS